MQLLIYINVYAKLIITIAVCFGKAINGIKSMSF